MTPLAPRFNAARMSTPASPVEANRQESQPVRAADGGVSVAAVERNPQGARLGKMVYKLRHPDHGELTLTRHPKEPDSKEVRFELKLHDLSQAESRMTKAVYVTNEDPDHGDHSTIGYGDIDFPEEMQNKGVSYMFHRALADAGELLRVDKVAIDSVVSPFLEAACLRMGMDNGDNAGGFNSPPDEMRQACDSILARRHWSIEPEQASRTRLLPQGLAPLENT